MKYVVVPMRLQKMLGAMVSCGDARAEAFDVVSLETGRAVAACPRRVDAEAVAGGLWAVDLLAEQAAESERCRRAACAALGTDQETLTAAIAALLEDRTDLLMRLLLIREEMEADNDDGIIEAACIAVAGVAA